MTPTDLDQASEVPAASDRTGPRSLTVLPMLAAHAAADPHGWAVVSGSDRVTAGEAVRRVARVLELLAVTGVEVGEPVAVIAERSPSAVLARLATLAAGAVCVPLDPQLPTARLRAIAADAQPRAVIASDRAWSEDLGVPWIPAKPGGVRSGPQVPTIPAESPAYIAYTSGTTGAPKGVVVPHRALTNLHTDLSARVITPAAAAVGRRLRVAHALSMGFDASWHPTLWLLRGHSLHVLSEPECCDPAAFATAIVRQRLDVVEALPSQIEQLLDVGLLDRAVQWRPSVLLMGGEPASPRLWRRLRRHRDVRAINFYGPTEATIAASWCDLSSRKTPSIGRPVVGTELHLLTPDGAPAEIGEVGELVITGSAVAAGYHNRPAETAEHFVLSPEESSPVGYRTGDLCRRASDGELEFVGRRDEQVKIRGYRVEICEIEATLREHSQIRAARVVIEGDRLLCAVVPAVPGVMSAEELRVFLAARLPDYMLPHHIALRDALPTGPTGKVDTAALVAELAGELRPTGPPPRTPEERAVAAVWERVLNMPPDSVGRADDFVTLGGHSLLLTLVTRELAYVGLPCAIRALANNPTVAELASRLACDYPQAS